MIYSSELYYKLKIYDMSISDRSIKNYLLIYTNYNYLNNLIRYTINIIYIINIYYI